MKYILIAFFSVACNNFSYTARITYTKRYDSINLDTVIRNDRLLKNYVHCLLDRGTCSPEGIELKRNLPEAIETACAKCTDAQRKGSRKIIHHLIKNKRHWWDELEAKYDPKKLYASRYSEELKKEGIVL